MNDFGKNSMNFYMLDWYNQLIFSMLITFTGSCSSYAPLDNIRQCGRKLTHNMDIDNGEFNWIGKIWLVNISMHLNLIKQFSDFYGRPNAPNLRNMGNYKQLIRNELKPTKVYVPVYASTPYPKKIKHYIDEGKMKKIRSNNILIFTIIFFRCANDRKRGNEIMKYAILCFVIR